MARAVLDVADHALRAALCAISLSLFGCALAHERDVGFAPSDASTPPDAFVVEADAGMALSCTERWTSLPWCPANTASMVGRHCETEGLACGTACCEPSPPIVCTDGVWMSAPEPDCSGVRCRRDVACGDGFCAADRVCLHTSSEIHLPDRCVVPPFALDSCGTAPAAWLDQEPRSCMQCRCEETTHVEFLECACCD